MSDVHPCLPPGVSDLTPGAEWKCQCGREWRLYVLDLSRFWRPVIPPASIAARYMAASRPKPPGERQL